jgi:glutamate dehydrogenase/leucine dehydrogenase
VSSSSDLHAIAAGHGVASLHLASDPESGLRAVVAVHSTALGAGLGGTRFLPYPSLADATTDVCRLARGMTYKHAVCGNDQGGAKAVLIGDPATLRSEALLRAYGRFLDSLGGLYLTAEDVGTTQADMDLLRSVTPYVTGASEALGGSGDPSPATAWGVRWALAAVAERLGRSLAELHVVVLGVGKVGSALVGHLLELGARVTVADVRPVSVPGATVVPVDEALTTECDVLSPNALGAVLSAATIPHLRCAAVCGAANNQLATDADGDRLAERGILYAPDYVVNAGGVINIASERSPGGYDRDAALRRVEGIADTLRRVFERADAHGLTPAQAADTIAEDRLAIG